MWVYQNELLICNLVIMMIKIVLLLSTLCLWHPIWVMFNLHLHVLLSIYMFIHFHQLNWNMVRHHNSSYKSMILNTHIHTLICFYLVIYQPYIGTYIYYFVSFLSLSFLFNSTYLLYSEWSFFQACDATKPVFLETLS